ncbi:MAG: AraC family transcriptional regulator ligand-binding domain-containing protein [Edaphobacter sp.]|uniref:AraC family transcriptional regulator n=1 Tax=Edaphobacter sp. TaxID=1934404 RepID=UPI002384D0F4|nr:AraC family transcriptional regulator [Edaphobacter sp.]MDE1178800.1 AraC family transcriptional regulator ligand-binding domain-containing protein [Edaphobacter sp.]
MNKHFRVAGRVALKLEECGVPVSDVLRRANLPSDLFLQTRVLVTTPQLFALWRAIGEVSSDPAIGIKLGTEDRTEWFHPSGLASLSTENFRAAVDHMARYKQLTCPEEMVQHTADGEWTIRFRWLLAVDSEPQPLVDYCFAWMQSIARKGSGLPISPIRIELIHPRTHTRAIEQHFNCPVISTGISTNAIVFRTADGQHPFQTRNAELLDMLAPQFDLELSRSTGSENFLERVHAAIQQRLTGRRPGIDDIARDLHMSARTLQRRLQESGRTYQQILDTARHQMARYYLGNSVLELNEAAYLLGYEDSNSFVRAFRTWEGVPPGVWRETNRAVPLQ